MYAGRVFDASANRIAYIASSGRLQPSGQIMWVSADQAAEPLVVVLDIDDDSFDGLQMAGGAKLRRDLHPIDASDSHHSTRDDSHGCVAKLCHSLMTFRGARVRVTTS